MAMSFLKNDLYLLINDSRYRASAAKWTKHLSKMTLPSGENHFMIMLSPAARSSLSLCGMYLQESTWQTTKGPGSHGFSWSDGRFTEF
jgi:hypothetical protein